MNLTLKPSVCLFFTYGTSLKDWAESGLLEREIAPYLKLCEMGVEVAFLTYGDQTDLEYQNRLGKIKIIPAYATYPKSQNKVLRFLDSLVIPMRLRSSLTRYSILKTNQMRGSWVPLVAKFILRAKLLVRCGYELYQFSVLEKRSLFRQWFHFIHSKIAYAYADQVVVTTKRIARFVVDTFKVPESKVAVQSNMIDTDIFSKVNLDNLYSNRIVFVGRLTRQKNLFNLIEASKIASVTLDIIGTGELKLPLLEYAERIGADVNFLGSAANDEIPKMISKYPVFVLPSLFEGHPKSLLEAMSCEMAVVATNVEGISDMIRNGKTGLLCGTEAEELAASIKEVIQNPAMRSNLGNQARKYVQESCDMKQLVEKELALYQSLLVS